MDKAEAIHAFWFEGVEWGPPGSDPAESGRPTEAAFTRWFEGGPAFDAEIRGTFADDIDQALSGQLDGWAEQATDRVALVLLLDQFTRNAFRDQARAFAGDPAAQRFRGALGR